MNPGSQNSPLVIPLNPNGASSFIIRTILDSVFYNMRFDWNERQAKWLLSIFDANGNPLLTCLCMVINWDLISRFQIPGQPNGRLVLVDTSGQNLDAGFSDLGGRCLLMYRPVS